MPSIVDLISQRFNGMFNAPGPAGYVDDPSMGGLVEALNKRKMQGTLPAMPTVPLQNNIAMQQPPQMPPQMGTGGPQGGPQPPQPMQAPQQPPMQMQPQQPQQGGLKGFLNSPKGDALMGLLQGWAQGGTWQESLGAGGAGAVAGLKQGKKNKTLQLFLDSQPNMDPAIKGLLASDPDLAKQYIAAMFKGGGDGTAEMRNWRYGQANPDFMKFLESARNGGGGVGLQPIFGYDAQDNPIVMQLGKDGEAVATKMPEGVRPMGPGGMAAEREAGKAMGGARFDLPSVENASNRIISTIDAVLKDPSLSSVTGPIQGRLGAFTGGQARAQSRIDEISGGAFLTAFQDLKGGGAITEKEGEAATKALTRLTTQTMGDADYIDALNEFRTEVEKLVEVARRKAGQASQGGNSDGWQDVGSGVRIRALP